MRGWFARKWDADVCCGGPQMLDDVSGPGGGALPSSGSAVMLDAGRTFRVAWLRCCKQGSRVVRCVSKASQLMKETAVLISWRAACRPVVFFSLIVARNECSIDGSAGCAASFQPRVEPRVRGLYTGVVCAVMRSLRVATYTFFVV